MTTYTLGHSPTISQQAQEAREKRRAILEGVRKRREIIYAQYCNRLKARLFEADVAECVFYGHKKRHYFPFEASALDNHRTMGLEKA